MDNEDIKVLESFATESRGFENSLYLIYQLVLERLPKHASLNEQEMQILIMKVLQKNSWKTLIKRMNNKLSGKKEALELMRNAVKKLLT